MNKEYKELWDQVPNDENELDTVDRDFVTWETGHNVLYHENDGFRVGVNKFGRKTFYFNVKDKDEFKVLSITSTRLMIKLKKLGPLAGLVIRYDRTGDGYETEYSIVVQ